MPNKDEAEKPSPAQVFALMAVLMETCLRLHECGRGERGL
jgi:hypothetical protein